MKLKENLKELSDYIECSTEPRFPFIKIFINFLFQVCLSNPADLRELVIVKYLLTESFQNRFEVDVVLREKKEIFHNFSFRTH